MVLPAFTRSFTHAFFYSPWVRALAVPQDQVWAIQSRRTSRNNVSGIRGGVSYAMETFYGVSRKQVDNAELKLFTVIVRANDSLG